MGKSTACIAIRDVALLIAASSIVSTGFAQNGVWTTKTSMPTPRSALASAVVDGKVYAIGGFDDEFTRLGTNESYDPVTDTWTAKQDMPTPRNALCVCAVNGKIYAIGGFDFAPGRLSTTEEYDPATDTWGARANMPTARAALSCSAVNGKIYAMGGSTGQSALSVVEEYDPMTNIWQTKTAMPTPRQTFASSELDGLIYVFGGASDNFGQEIPEQVDVYNPGLNTWVTINTSMPIPRDNVSAATLNEIIYVFGGRTAEFTWPRVDIYDPVSNSWTTAPNMPTPRLNLATSTVTARIYAIGGGQLGAVFRVLSTVEEFDPTPTSVEDHTTRLPESFVLHQNYPNPFNPATTIIYELSKPARVALKVINVLGQEVRTLVDEEKQSGFYDVVWDGRDQHGNRLASGVYLLKFEANDFAQTRKMILMQ
jgi:N-acetylneuraminic acid mutarotase